MKGGEKLMVTITAKFQIYPSLDQAESLRISMKAYTSACNWVSEKVFETHNLVQSKLNKLYYQELRSRFGLKSQMAQSVLMTVIARYKSLQSNNHDWTQVIFKSSEYDLVWNRDYSLVNGRFSVNSLDGRLSIPFEQKFMKKYLNADWKFGTAKTVYKFNKWFLHVPVTANRDLECPLNDIKLVVGIDLGINFIATTYDSQGYSSFFDGHEVKHRRGKYKKLRKELQQRQTASARKRLKQVGQRENRYIRDINHRITKALVEKYPKGTCFVLEDLTGIRNATEKVRVKDRYVSVSWAFHQFRLMLEYKAVLNGQTVLLVDPKYTSQCCPKCGHTERLNRDKKNHVFKCRTCHYESNDDRVGAMNIYRKGIEKLSQTVAE